MALDAPVTLNGLSLDIPREMVGSILTSATEQTVAGRLGTATPLTLAGSTQYVYDGNIEVGLVAEGGVKPQSGAGLTAKSIDPAKVATIVVISKEALSLNPANFVQAIEADLSASLARGLDSLMIHGRDLRGNAYSGTNTSILGAGTTATTVALPENLNDGQALTAAALDAYAAAGAGGGVPNGWAVDSRLRVPFGLASQSPEARQSLPTLTAAMDNIAGLPAAYSPAVAGGSSYVDETAHRAILGDWNQVRYGFVERLSIQRSSEATVGGVSMFETNQVALLVEAIFGWTVLDQSKFAVLDAAAAGA